MNKNLLKRIYTSITLSLVLLSSLFFHKYSWLLLLTVASIICFYEFNNIIKKIWKRKKILISFANIICLFYLVFFTYAAFDIAKFSREEMLYLLLVCIFSDIGGYVVGKSIGGKKLTKISPNKTISGSFGSFLFSLIPYIFLILFQEVTKVNFYTLFFITIILSFICQVGDLFISYFKRKSKIKDTGTLLPGHGGLLDRIDGIIFAVPAAFILDKIFI